MKAMILAAGRGERLRPITDTLPKPLVEVGGRPLAVWHIERLAYAGFRDIVINVSHLGGLIESRLGDGGTWGVSIAYSREAAPLETAGGIAAARALLGSERFLLVNADVYCDADLAGFAARAASGDLAHLLLVPNPPFRPDGDFSFSAGRIGTAPAPRYTYTGIAVLSPQVVSHVRAGDKAPLGPLLRDAAAKGRAGGEIHRGAWSDVGTAERLAALAASLNEERRT